MRYGVLLAACVPVLAGLSACSGSSGGGDAAATTAAPTTTVAPTTTTRPPPTAEELKEWTLAVADLPPGWAAEPTTTTTTTTGKAPGAGTDTSEGEANDFLCPAAKSLLEKDKGPAEAEAQFTRAQNGPFLFQSIAAVKDAPAEFAEAKRAFESCIGQQWQTDFSGEPMDMTIAVVSAPKVGDETAAFRVTGKATGIPVTLTMDFVLVRRADIPQLYAAMNANSPMLATTPLGADEFADIVADGDAKVEAKLQSKGVTA